MSALVETHPTLSNRIGSNRIRAARKIIWSPVADSRLVRMRQEGMSLRAMARAFGLSRCTISERATCLGLSVPKRASAAVCSDESRCEMSADQRQEQSVCDPQREALPAGHPITWGLITAGTCLDGMEYATPPTSRFESPRSDELGHQGGFGAAEAGGCEA